MRPRELAVGVGSGPRFSLIPSDLPRNCLGGVGWGRAPQDPLASTLVVKGVVCLQDKWGN